MVSGRGVVSVLYDLVTFMILFNTCLPLTTGVTNKPILFYPSEILAQILTILSVISLENLDWSITNVMISNQISFNTEPINLNNNNHNKTLLANKNMINFIIITWANCLLLFFKGESDIIYRVSQKKGSLETLYKKS